jgi:hypothetical protein
VAKLKGIHLRNELSRALELAGRHVVDILYLEPSNQLSRGQVGDLNVDCLIVIIGERCLEGVAFGPRRYWIVRVTDNPHVIQVTLVSLRYLYPRSGRIRPSIGPTPRTLGRDRGVAWNDDEVSCSFVGRLQDLTEALRGDIADLRLYVSRLIFTRRSPSKLGMSGVREFGVEEVGLDGGAFGDEFVGVVAGVP